MPYATNGRLVQFGLKQKHKPYANTYTCVVQSRSNAESQVQGGNVAMWLQSGALCLCVRVCVSLHLSRSS